ncbi:formylglycine-generating enzyme family protein [Caballeronia sp. LZ035]|uniref:formylglycine-generating enzyme family protein n=1 Tax=Caballeronia sp. LZ035 TaxID=3038568 RepID=UPI0028629893|nr:formylglycine-generating enzyme family protein [Caballeronia sp. LZ035]MDR5761029.1 formylglycine-generating enzyme family protein [Caballeronia sp. LZ035]
MDHAAGRRRLVFGMVSAGALIGAGGLWSYSKTRHATVRIGDGMHGPLRMAWVPAGTFLMGSASRRAMPNEGPAHSVTLTGFWMSENDVTNAEFAAFVAATGYKTTAEQTPRWEDLAPQLPPGTPRLPESELVPGALVFVGTDEPVPLQDVGRWWQYMPGADWRHPLGPDSSIAGKEQHPVVQVSHRDAVAYAAWAGGRLPTESQWEYAARGGIEQADFVWGDDAPPRNGPRANVWRDERTPFPVVTTASEKIAVGTMPVGTFAANGYGLHDMAGNVWQWTADWYRSDAFRQLAASAPGRAAVDPSGPSDSFDPDEPGVPSNAPKRVTRGGSFLCSETYCQSYRTSARRGTDPMNSMSHLGFRIVMSEEDWGRRRRV